MVSLSHVTVFQIQFEICLRNIQYLLINGRTVCSCIMLKMQKLDYDQIQPFIHHFDTGMDQKNIFNIQMCECTNY